MDLDALYQEIILDHYKHPLHKGLREPYGAEVHHVNPTCGDEITLRVTSDLSDISYDGMGCSISQASASMLCERVEGMTLDEAKKINRDEVLEMLGIQLGPVRLKCALLALKTLKAGVYGIDQWPGEEEEVAS